MILCTFKLSLMSAVKWSVSCCHQDVNVIISFLGLGPLQTLLSSAPRKS